MIGIWFNEKIPLNKSQREEWFMVEDGWAISLDKLGGITLAHEGHGIRLTPRNMPHVVLYAL